MVMRWRAGTSHHTPDALSRLLRPGPAAEPIVDYFPDDATSGERSDYVGPQGLVLSEIALNDLEPLEEGGANAGGGRERRVGVRPAEVTPAEVTPARCALATWSHRRYRIYYRFARTLLHPTPPRRRA